MSHSPPLTFLSHNLVNENRTWYFVSSVNYFLSFSHYCDEITSIYSHNIYSQNKMNTTVRSNSFSGDRVWWHEKKRAVKAVYDSQKQKVYLCGNTCSLMFHCRTISECTRNWYSVHRDHIVVIVDRPVTSWRRMQQQHGHGLLEM